MTPDLFDGADDFRDAYRQRWNDEPFDSAIYYFDAALLTAFALENAAAVAVDGDISTSALVDSFLTVASPPGVLRAWNEAAQTIEALRGGERV